MLPCHRPAFSATLSRAVPSSFRQHRSRLRRSSTSCAGGNPLLLPLRLQPLSLLVAVGAPLWPPPLPRRASPQVQGHPVHFSQTRRCSCLACGNRSPTGEGRDRAGPSSRYEVGVVQPRLHCAQERWWVTTDLGSASFEPCTSQAAVQDVDAETHFWMRPSPRLVCSNRPEGRVLSCLDPPMTQAIPAFRVRGTGVSVQGPALRAVPVASRLHQSRGGGPSPPERTRCAHSQLPQRLAHTHTVSQAVVCTQGPGAQAPQPAGPSGQLGKEQTRANAEDLFSRIPRWAWKCGTYRVQITPACRKTFRPWSDPSFLRAGVPLEQVSRHAVVFTDASTTGWGATYNGHAVSGVWTGPQLHWHINCLELLAVRLALSRLRGRLQHKDVLVRTDNTATVAYIKRQGGLRSRRMSQLARHLLLWSQKHLRSLRAIHIPGVFNRAADELSRAALPGEWRLHPQAVQLIWGRFGAAQVDLFASPETTHCQEFYSLTEATLGTDALAHSWPRGPAQICVPPSEPTSTDTVQDQGGRGAGLVSGSILAQQDLVPGTHAPRDSPSLANSSEEGSAFSETGHPMAPAPGPVETPRMVPGWDAEVLADLPQEVALTITSARAPSTRRAYTLKWNLFVEWCSSHQEDPRRCSIRAVLSILQQGLERRLSPSTLKVYVAAISAYHDPVEGKSVGKHNLVVRFLRGARRLNPPRPPSLPSWDLALVLRALITAPF